MKSCGSKCLGTITTIVILVTIVVLPLFADRMTLPTGWELPKVYIVQIVGLTLATTSLVIILANRNSQQRKITAAVLIGCVALIVFSLLFKEFIFSRTITFTSNPLYRFLLSCSKISSLPISVIGNQFRDFGIISLIALVGIGSFLFVTPRKILNTLPYAFVLSGLIQSAVGIYQFLTLLSNHSSLIHSGTSVYGTFGQSNFYTGHLLTTLVAALYLAKRQGRKSTLWFIPALVTTVGIGTSLSTWAITSMIFVVIFFILWELCGIKPMYKIALGILILSSIATYVIAFIPTDSTRTSSFRRILWNNVTESYITEVDSTNTLLTGTGMDTLGAQFQKEARLPGKYVDRAHNYLLDIHSSFGLVGIFVYLSGVGFLLFTVRDGTTPFQAFLIIAFTVWHIRSLIHTSSIVNYVDLAIIASGLTSAALLPTKE